MLSVRSLGFLKCFACLAPIRVTEPHYRFRLAGVALFHLSYYTSIGPSVLHWPSPLRVTERNHPFRLYGQELHAGVLGFSPAQVLLCFNSPHLGYRTALPIPAKSTARGCILKFPVLHYRKNKHLKNRGRVEISERTPYTASFSITWESKVGPTRP